MMMKLHKSLLLFGASVLLLMACDSSELAEESEIADATETEEVSTEELLEKAKEEATGESYEQALQEQTEYSNDLPTFDVKEIMLVFDDYISSDPLFEVAIIRATDVKTELPDYLQDSDHYPSDQLIMIEVHYKNLNNPDNVYLQLSDFQVYGEHGRLLESINQFAGGDPIAQGRTATATLYVEYEEHQDIIEIDYLSQGETLGTFIIPVEH